jgi:hypothetical protein
MLRAEVHRVVLDLLHALLDQRSKDCHEGTKDPTKSKREFFISVPAPLRDFRAFVAIFALAPILVHFFSADVRSAWAWS